MDNFCHYCGASLKLSETKETFDVVTGKPDGGVVDLARCPNDCNMDNRLKFQRIA